MSSTQVLRKTLTASVLEILREKIISHEIRAGQPLRQDALAEQLNVSRIPIREALFQLEAEGLIRFVPHKGAVASEISVAEVEELFSLRVLIECDLLGKALPRTTDKYISVSRQLLAEFDKLLKPSADLHAWGALNERFHKSLYEPAGCKKAMGIVGQLHKSCERYLRLEIQLTADYARAEKEHHELLDLCERRDKRGAIKCLRNHIETTGKQVVRVIERFPISQRG